MCVSEWHAMLRDSGASCGVGAVGLSLAAAAVGLLVRLLLLCCCCAAAAQLAPAAAPAAIASEALSWVERVDASY